jgi:hypothetical protein
MKMRMENGELANSDKENMEVFGKHLNHVYNTQRPKYQDAAKLIAQREVMTEMGDDVSWEEFNQAITKLKNDKSPGENEIPPNAFKCLDSENRTKVYEYIRAFWNEEMDYEEWHTGLVKLLPKFGDLSDPNKWRGITLMDVCSKIFSVILTARAQKLLSKCGIKQQFGGTPLVGYADGQFVLKTLLHLRHQHNLPTYVLFVDLVKAYDTVDHELLFEILERYGAYPKFVSAVRRLYDSLINKVVIGSERTEIEQTVGVRQGDNLSPVLFLFVMSAFAESLDDVLVAYEVEKTKFKRVSTENFNQGQLIGHKPVTYATGEEFELCDIYFVDDGAFAFGDRDILTRAAPIIDEHLVKFQLEMHVGTVDEFGVETASKTECVFFPPIHFFKPAAMIEEASTEDETTDLATKPKRESASARADREGRLYDQAPETRRIEISERGFIDFTRVFKNLGTLVSYDLRDDIDIKMRIKKASQAMGRMRNVWDDIYVDKETKYLSFLAIPIYLLMWGCETWALKAENVRNLDVFIHRSRCSK